MKINISNKQLREFGLLIGIGIPLIIGYFLPLLRSHNFNYWTLYIGLPALILGILKPRVLYFPYKLWMRIGYILGWINSRLILSLVFFIILLPMSLVMKTFGYDPFKLKDKKQMSYKENKTDYNIDLDRIF